MFSTYLSHSYLFNSYLVTFLLNTVSRAQSVLFFCHIYSENQNTQLTQSLFTGTDFLFQDDPCSFDLIEEYIHHCNKKDITNFRKPLGVGLKLAITLKYYWNTWKQEKCRSFNSFTGLLAKPLFLLSLGPSGLNSNNLTCPTTPEDWKQIKENQMECLPLSWGTKWEAYRHKEAKVIGEWIFQL